MINMFFIYYTDFMKHNCLVISLRMNYLGDKPVVVFYERTGYLRFANLLITNGGSLRIFNERPKLDY